MAGGCVRGVAERRRPRLHAGAGCGRVSGDWWSGGRCWGGTVCGGKASFPLDGVVVIVNQVFRYGRVGPMAAELGRCARSTGYCEIARYLDD